VKGVQIEGTIDGHLDGIFRLVSVVRHGH
jgi:hypothetical protein